MLAFSEARPTQLGYLCLALLPLFAAYYRRLCWVTIGLCVRGLRLSLTLCGQSFEGSVPLEKAEPRAGRSLIGYCRSTGLGMLGLLGLRTDESPFGASL